MENKIEISIIIPLYNSENYIVNTISSILSQEEHGLTYEIIVVDDLSTDNSKEVVRGLKNEKIKLIELEKNGGTANARNAGLKVAQGEWIQFVDSDDIFSNDLYKKFERSRNAYSNCYIFSFICEYKNYNLRQMIAEVKDKRAFGFFGSVCNKFIKRNICIEFKTDQGFEDVCFIIDMMNEKELNISLIKDAYYTYNRKNAQSKMANFSIMEYQKMHSYAMSQINKSDDYTRMFMLEIFVALLFDRAMPFFMSLKIATKTLLRLYKYLPRVYFNQNRRFIINTKIAV